MARTSILVIVTTMLCGTAVAQMGGMGGFGSVGNPFSMTDPPAGGGVSTGWRPWLTANGNYVKPLSNSDRISPYTPAAAALSGGIGGYKNWGMKRLGGGYTGLVSYNPQSSGGLGKWRLSQSANLSYAQQVSQRLNFSLSQMGGITYGGYGVNSGFGVNGVPGTTTSYGAGGSAAGIDPGNGAFGDPAVNGFVDNEIYADRVKYYGAGGGASYLLSQRLSVSAFGGVNLVRRNQGIQSTNSYNAGLQTNYRLDSRNMVGAGAIYGTSSYRSYFGSVRSLSYVGTWSHQFNPTTMFSAQAGAANVISKFVGSVALPPEIAAIIGAGTTLQVTETNFWSPTFSAVLSKMFEYGGLTAGASRSVSAGNGVVLAGMRDMYFVGFGVPFTPKLSMHLTSAYTRASGRVGIQSVTQTAQAAATLSYRLAAGFSVNVQGGTRYIGVPGHYRRSDLFAGGGISWAPGTLPFFF